MTDDDNRGETVGPPFRNRLLSRQGCLRHQAKPIVNS
jgi:hypothetical protein